MVIKKYWFIYIVIFATVAISIVNPIIGKRVLLSTGKTLLNFVISIPPIFICIGLLDTWIDKETIIEIMGEGSGIKGNITAIVFGIITAVPIYALLPISGLMIKKECKIANVLLFLCSCSSIRIPLLLFEINSLGIKYAIIRLVCNLIAVILIAIVISKLISEKEKEIIYINAKDID